MDRQKVYDYALGLGFHRVGVAAIPDQDQELAHLQAWLGSGYQADMVWMANRRPIQDLMPGVRSVICVALNYYTAHRHSDQPGKISRYGWGRDYHKVMGSKLKALVRWLESQGARARFFVDTGPVQDKVWAERAGLGWISKNGNLITREYGSWVFLGEVLTDLELVAEVPHAAHCGSCTRCLEACPTQAITRPFVVDANRCIAYHTIENRAAELPEDIDLGGWVAGCDICQDVCPWNQRFAQVTDVEDFWPRPENLVVNLLELATLSEVEWDRRFRGSALRRIKAFMWRRNARKVLNSFHSSQGGRGV